MSRSSSGAPGWESLETALRAELAPDLELVRRIGGGGATAVFLAREPALQRLVAVKLLRPGSSTGKARERFMREVRAIARISHPNVLSLHRIGTILDDAPYVVMQYVRGRNLAERLGETGSVSVTEARRLIGSLASALAAAHSRDILHRDINPTNVLCEEDSGQVFLADFGLALLLGAEGAPGSRLTTKGHVIGNLRYLSPEQMADEEPTRKSDIWGLGVLAWEILTGRGPFDHDSLSDTLRASQESLAPSLSLESTGLASHEVEILDRCVSRDPRNRPDAREIDAALARISEQAGGAESRSTSSAPVEPAVLQAPDARHLLRALGGLDLESRIESDVAAVRRQPKRMALLVLLSAGGKSGRMRRDKLIGLLWPEADQSHGRHALRQSLYFIRQKLGSGLLDAPGGTEIGIRRDWLVCDVEEFKRHARAGRAEAAMSWYRGDLLPGFYLDDAVEFERWLESERIALRRTAASCCWELADRKATEGDEVSAGAWARRAAGFTPYDESALQRLIQVLDGLGDRAGALQAFEQFTSRLAEEYAAEPSPETMALVEQVRSRT
ncbi:MAG: protein kinase [marine benthic group bacterium]|nr:protein kinase [Candidatus Carthagonibacter metallireducens]